MLSVSKLNFERRKDAKIFLRVFNVNFFKYLLKPKRCHLVSCLEIGQYFEIFGDGTI